MTTGGSSLSAGSPPTTTIDWILVAGVESTLTDDAGNAISEPRAGTDEMAAGLEKFVKEI